jgi:hypothetical protein
MSLGGIVRHEQAQRGAHEGSSGQLYRPPPRDGFLGHAFGQGVEVVLFACHSGRLLSRGVGLVGPAALPNRHSMVGYEGRRNSQEPLTGGFTRILSKPF